MADTEQQIALERYPSDVIRLLAGLIIFAGCALLAIRSVPVLQERDLFRLINNMPESISLPAQAVMQAGALAAALIFAAIALLTRRWRLAVDLLLSSTLAWLFTKWLKTAIERDRPILIIDGLLIRGPEATGLGFPSGHAAVAAALATAAGPYVSQKTGRVLWLVVWLVGVARVYVGAHLPLDVVGGIALGWAVGAAVHLLLGTPTKRPTPDEIRQALETAGIETARVYVPNVDARGSAPFFAETADGTQLFVKVVGQEQRYADWLFKTTRRFIYRELEDEDPFMSPKQQIEHEAYMSLLAQRANVRTPPIVLAIQIEGDAGLLAQEKVSARGLDDLSADELDDNVLRAIWDQVALLRQSRIAHRDLRQANVMVDDHGQPWLIDFGFGEAGPSERRLNQDVTELMASMACLVGARRTVTTALDVLGEEAVMGAMPLLQPLALSTATRTDVKAQPGLREEIRQQVAELTGKTPPPLERITRLPLRPRT
jgi:membrane-associated phospholipid phosphatase/tRNA A-37 threonylcarbamoyl transferase component Bud32